MLPYPRQSSQFGYLDILGFKNIVKQNSFTQLKNVVEGFTIECADAIDKSRRIGDIRIKLSESSVHGKSGIHARIVSDSIYVWTENDDRLKQFDDLLQMVNTLIVLYSPKE